MHDDVPESLNMFIISYYIIWHGIGWKWNKNVEMGWVPIWPDTVIRIIERVKICIIIWTTSCNTASWSSFEVIPFSFKACNNKKDT